MLSIVQDGPNRSKGHLNYSDVILVVDGSWVTSSDAKQQPWTLQVTTILRTIIETPEPSRRSCDETHN